MDLNNIVGFKAVDKNGNERQVTVDEMTELVSARIVSAASEISTFAAATAAGTDEFEDQLPQSDTFSWLRTLDGSKNPTLTSSSAAAKVLGGLLGISSCLKNKGAISVTDFNNIKELGIYVVNPVNETGDIFTDSTANSPVGAYDHGNIIVFNNTQIYIPDMYSTSGIFLRLIGIWGWFKINTIKL